MCVCAPAIDFLLTAVATTHYTYTHILDQRSPRGPATSTIHTTFALAQTFFRLYISVQGGTNLHVEPNDLYHFCSTPYTPPSHEAICPSDLRAERRPQVLALVCSKERRVQLGRGVAHERLILWPNLHPPLLLLLAPTLRQQKRVIRMP